MSQYTYQRKPPWLAYTVTLLSCVGCFWLYRLIVVPRIEPGRLPIKQLPHDLPSQLAEDDDHHRWFHDGDWERGPCSILHTANGKILFDDYQIVDSQTWLVVPFSMIIQREPDAAKPSKELPPLVLRCQHGARLRFEHPVDAKIGGSRFQLQDAQLEGQVELYRRSLQRPEEDEIRIETSNIRVNSQQILTIEDVAFRMGNHQGIGRHLAIQLTHDGPLQPKARQFDRIKGIHRIRMGRLSSLRLMPLTDNRPDRDRMFSPSAAPIEITTTGPFEFDFRTDVARFQNRVQVRKLDADSDTLHCDELVMRFRSSNQSELRLDAAEDLEFELQSISARGAPAVLHAHSQHARIQADSLEYDLPQQLVRASSQDHLHLIRDDFQFIARSMVYHLTGDQTPGKLLAHGPGQLLRDQADQPFRATWRDVLSLNRISEQQHAIQLTGAVQIHLDADNQMAAEQVELTVWEVPIVNQHHEFVRWSYQPEKLVATKEVHVSAKELIADTHRLVARWPSNPQAAPQLLNPIGHGQEFTTLWNSDHLVLRASYTQAVDHATPAKAIMAQGNSINATIADHNGKSELLALTVAGQTRVIRPHRLHPDHNDFEILGKSLQLTPQPAGNFRVQVQGNSQEPAVVRTEQLELRGKQIFMDQTANQVRVHGGGTAGINRSNSSWTPTISAADSIPQSGPDLQVEFNGGMIFDGEQIYFERQVKVNLQQSMDNGTSSTMASGDALNIKLDRRLKFSAPDDPTLATAQPQIVEMILLAELPQNLRQFDSPDQQSRPQLIQIQNNKTRSDGAFLERFSLAAFRATIDHRQNQLVADGPGWFEIYRRSENGKQPAGFGFVGLRQSNQDVNRLTYIRTNYQQQLLANIDVNEIVVTGNLRSVYVPVKSLNESYDPDRPGKLPAGAVQLSCQRIDLIQSSNSLMLQPASQFIASGNAYLRSETFESQADRITYRDDRDVLTIESTTGQNVLLKTRRDAHGRWDEIVGSELEYRLRDQTAHGKNIQRISATLRNTP